MALVKGSYKKNDPVYLQKKQYGKPKEMFKQVFKIIRSNLKTAPIDLIDFGCASGAFAFHAQKNLKCKSIAGIDIGDKLIAQAKAAIPSGDFRVGSINSPSRAFGTKKFSVGTCMGVLSLFDDISQPLKGMLSVIKPGGYLIICDLVNSDPVDVVMRYRITDKTLGNSDWSQGFNVRSQITYENILRKISRGFKIKYYNFKFPFRIPKQKNPLRAWTMRTENDPNQLVVGTRQLLTSTFVVIQKK